MIPSSRRISASAWRPVSSTVISASRSRSCSGLSRRRTALACTVMTLTECASTSWSSRVIRLRSSSTARRATSSASSIRCSASRARSEWRAVAAERTNVPTTGMLSQISSVAGTSGARMKTVQPATSSAPSAISAWRASSSEPAAQAARIRTRNIVSVSYAAVGSSSVKASGARGDRERDDERRPPPEEQRTGREERDRRRPGCGSRRRSSRCRSASGPRPRARAPRRRSPGPGRGRGESRRNGT